MRKRLFNKLVRVLATLVFALPLAAQNPDYDTALPPTSPLLPPGTLDQRPQRFGLLSGRIPPLLPVQPLRRPVGTHELGPRRQHRPPPLARASRRHPRARQHHDLHRQRRRRSPEHQRPLQSWGLPRRRLHRPHPNLRRHPPKPRTSPSASTRARNWAQYPRQPRPRPPHGRLSRSQRQLGSHRAPLGHGRLPAQRTQGSLLLLHRPQAMDTAQRLRPHWRRQRRLGVPRPHSHPLLEQRQDHLGSQSGS